MFAKAEGPEVRTAVDRLYDKLSRRAKKGTDIRRKHKSPDPATFPVLERRVGRVTVLTLQQLLDRRGELLISGARRRRAGLDRQITGADISSPGLVLAGFTERFPLSRSQVLGETEIMYLRSLDGDRRETVLRRFLANDVPCVDRHEGS